jgi:hypothetical protein
MNKGEPPSRCLSRSFPMLIGKNSRGQWVVQSQDGLCGGLFVNRTEALRFALFENGHRPDDVIMVGGTLELAINAPIKLGMGTDRGDRALSERAASKILRAMTLTPAQHHLSPSRLAP